MVVNPKIAVLIAVLAAAVICLTLLARRNVRDRSNVRPAAETFLYQPSAPMTGLDSALRESTDRDGMPMLQRLDSTTSHVESLRKEGDTGPLLRRALDHVLSPDPEPPTDS